MKDGGDEGGGSDGASGEGAGGESYGARAGAARAGAPKAAKLGSSSCCRRCYFSGGAAALELRWRRLLLGRLRASPRLSAQWHARRQRLLRKKGRARGD